MNSSLSNPASSSSSSESALSNLIKRLETATCRLEEIAGVAASTASTATAGQSQSSGATGTQAGGEPSGSLAGFEALLQGKELKAYLEKSEMIQSASTSSQLGSMNESLVQTLGATRDLINLAARFQKPMTGASSLESLFAPVQKSMVQLFSAKDSASRNDPLLNHYATLVEAAAAFSWPISKTPVSLIDEAKESAQFYANRILKSAKEGTLSTGVDRKVHIEWVSAYMAFFAELAAYVKTWHTTGLTWNPKGSSEAPSLGPASAPAPCASSHLPPPPPPPPSFSSDAAEPSSKQPDMAGLFSQLSKGEAITSGLRKVDRSQMTHKNPELRAGSLVPGQAQSSATAHSAGPKAQKSSSSVPPYFGLDGNKWRVEGQHHRQDLVITVAEMKNVIYIFDCSNCVIKVEGKVNAITLDHCQKTGLLVDSVLSSIDAVGSRSLQLQVIGSVPTIALDSVDGMTVYYSQACVNNDTQLLTSKCSEINLLTPLSKTQDSEFQERPIPEQFRTIVTKNGDLVTEPVTHSG